MLKKLNEGTNYWLVRTSDGEHYDEFVADNFIAIGWNEVLDLDFIKAAANNEEKQEDLKNIIKEHLKKNGENEKQAGRILNQISRFVNDISKGDIVLIPSKSSNLIEFGIIETDAYIYEKTFFSPDDNECDFLKRRKVKWVHREKKSHLDPYLYQLLNSHHAVSIANDYAHNIDRTLNKFYIKGDKAHFVLEVKLETEIYGSQIVDLINETLAIVDDFNETMGTSYERNKVQIQINVQSPGFIELFGHIETIAIIGFVYATIFGARIKLPLFEFETQGFVEKIKQFIESNQKYKLENKKLDLQEKLHALKVDVPEELDVKMYEEQEAEA